MSGLVGSPRPQSRAAQWLPWLLWGVFTVSWAGQWPRLPVMLDPAYHLLVAQEVVAAGGPIGFETWQWAPVGRPNLYPPVLHVLLAGLIQWHLPPLEAIRLLSVVLPTLLVASLWLVTRRRCGVDVGLACLAVTLTVPSFHHHTAMALAAALGLIELLWWIEAIEQRRVMAAGLLVALLCYTHLGLPAVAGVMGLIYWALRPDRRHEILASAWGVLLVIPWWWHLWHHRAFLHPIARYENAVVQLPIMLWGAGLIGLWVCWRSKSRYAWLMACLIGMAVFAPVYRYRWLNGEGLIPVLILAGIGLDRVAGWLATTIQRQQACAIATIRAPWSNLRWLITLCLVLVLQVATVAVWSSGRINWRAGMATEEPVAGLQSQTGLGSRAMRGVVDSVQRIARPGEILWSNAPYAVGWVAALLAHPTASAMLNEISPAKLFEPRDAAQVLMWFKFEPVPQQLVHQPGVTLVTDDEIVTIFRQPGTPFTVPPPRAVIPLWIAWWLMGVMVLSLIWDLGARGRTTMKVG